jgi:membrane protein
MLNCSWRAGSRAGRWTAAPALRFQASPVPETVIATRKKPSRAKPAVAKPSVARRVAAETTAAANVAALAATEVPKVKPAVEKIVRPARGGLALAALNRFIDADLLSQAAALAFYAVLSLAPLMLLLLWLAGALLPDAQGAFVDQIGILAGSDARRVAQSIIDASKATPDTQSIAGWGSIVALFVAATAVFAQLQDVLNRIFRTDATHLPDIATWLRKRIFSFSLVFAVAFLLLVSLSVTTVLQLVFSRYDWMLPVVALGASGLVYAIAFALMYSFLPDRRVAWRRALGGGALTAGLFLVGRAAITWYLDQVNPTSTYGSMSALALALLWIYYACLVVFIGALFTAVFDERQRAASP